jgi:DNA-binding LytR/AlgR family response regulator
MTNFAFCYELNEELEYICEEVVKCFKLREIEIAVKIYHNAYELLRCISCNCPDILFYDMESEDGLIKAAAIAAKRVNSSLISVVTKSNDYEAGDNDHILEPIYILPKLDRRHLWTYAFLAYETFLDNHDSFSYYVRPDYIHIPLNDIVYFASEGRRTHIISGGYRDTFYQKLDDIETMLIHKNAHFIRIHKSYLVNSLFISCYSRDFVTLTTGEKLRISKYEYYRILNKNFINSDLPVRRIAGYC